MEKPGGRAIVDTNIQKYQALVEAVRCGSFTRAAHNLSYSQSGVSRMIADLERDWGLRLVERGRAGVSPTGDGRQLMPLVEAVCEDYRRLTARASELRDLDAGTISVGTFSSVATYVLPPAIRRFQQEYPGVDYELLMGDYSEIERWVAEGRVDFGFLPYAPRTPGLVCEPLLSDELRVVMPEGHPLASHAAVRLEELLDDPFILLERSGDDEVTPLFERAGLSPRVRFTTWDDYAIMSMVENGLGLAVLPSLILSRAPYRIETRPLAEPVGRKISVVFRAGSLGVAARLFIDFLRARDAV